MVASVVMGAEISAERIPLRSPADHSSRCLSGEGGYRFDDCWFTRPRPRGIYRGPLGYGHAGNGDEHEKWAAELLNRYAAASTEKYSPARVGVATP
jgi:hypothetical protein